MSGCAGVWPFGDFGGWGEGGGLRLTWYGWRRVGGEFGVQWPGGGVSGQRLAFRRRVGSESDGGVTSVFSVEELRCNARKVGGGAYGWMEEFSGRSKIPCTCCSRTPLTKSLRSRPNCLV